MGTNKKISELKSIDTYDSTTYVPVSTGDGQVTRKLAVTSISPSGSGYTPYSNKTIQVSDITLLSTNWNSGTPWTYVLTNANITPDKFVDVIPSISSSDIVVAAQIYQQTLSGNGNVTLYSKNQPSGDIIITIRIFE